MNNVYGSGTNLMMMNQTANINNFTNLADEIKDREKDNPLAFSYGRMNKNSQLKHRRTTY